MKEYKTELTQRIYREVIIGGDGVEYTEGQFQIILIACTAIDDILLQAKEYREKTLPALRRKYGQEL